ncbi:MAG TPA: hypothetical protein VGZ93_06175 [Candidatus Methylacidiphilales bacterium]|jgi:hypothetical protein|nr:hypothetical protein [Candidatus Methylacidiphilales bacterium]
MNTNPPPVPPPFPGPSGNLPKKDRTTRNILLGCGLALLIGLGLIILISIEVCSGLNNMH